MKKRRVTQFAIAGVAIGATLAALGREARAYCFAVSENGPASVDERVTCFTGSPAAKPLFWPGACTGYDLQTNASRRIPLEVATRAAADAFAAWSNVDCGGGAYPSVNAAIDLGPVACGDVQYNAARPNQNLIVFRDDAWPYPGGSTTLALTTLHFDAVSTLTQIDGLVTTEVDGALATPACVRTRCRCRKARVSACDLRWLGGR